MSTSKRWITGLVVGGLVGFALYKLLKLRRDDRPPIRVRGGSIFFETACGWSEAAKADEWVQNLDAPPPITGFSVAIHKGTSTTVQQGTMVQINQGAAMLVLRIDSEGEPRLGPRSRLPKETGSGPQPVKDPHNTLDSVHVIPAHQPERLSAGDWIEVTFY